MGHKVNPYGFRLGIIYPHKSKWYARKDYAQALHADVRIRKYITGKLTRAGISGVDIERKGDQVQVFIRTARPGIVIGRKGAEVDRIRKDVEKITGKRVDIKVEDMNQSASELRPETDAALLAQDAKVQLVEGSAVECHAALGRPVEPEHELRERALAGAGPADERDLRARRARDAHVSDRRPGDLPITERHAVEADLST